MNGLNPTLQTHDVQTLLQCVPTCIPLLLHRQLLLQLPSSFYCGHYVAVVAVAYTLSVAYHLVRRLCDELGCHSTVAGDIDQVEGWGSMVQEPAVGTLLVVVVGKLVVGNSVAVEHLREGKDLVHTLVVVDLMDMEVAAHRLLVAEEALESMAEEGQLRIDRHKQKY